MGMLEAVLRPATHLQASQLVLEFLSAEEKGLVWSARFLLIRPQMFGGVYTLGQSHQHTRCSNAFNYIDSTLEDRSPSSL
jgi:hypothetical protein